LEIARHHKFDHMIDVVKADQGNARTFGYAAGLTALIDALS